MGRPKTRILIISTDEDKRGELAFALQINGYAVCQADTPHTDLGADLIIALGPWDTSGLKKLRRRCLCPLMAQVGKMATASPVSWADWSVPHDLPRNILLERIKEATERKRGPKKGFRNFNLNHPQPATTSAA